MGEEKDLLSSLLLELRRGTLTMSVLSQMKEPKYGYALVQSLEEKGVAIDPNTLYPLLRRLENQGLLESRWETGGAGFAFAMLLGAFLVCKGECGRGKRSARAGAREHKARGKEGAQGCRGYSAVGHDVQILSHLAPREGRSRAGESFERGGRVCLGAKLVYPG